MKTKKEFNKKLWEFKTSFGVPPFGEITVEDFRVAFTVGIKEYQADILSIINNSEDPTFENTFIALDNAGELLTKVKITFANETYINSSEEIRKLDEEITPKLSKVSNEILFNADLFKRVSTLYQKRNSLNLSKDQLFLLENLYHSFTANGANLAQKDKNKLIEINQNISSLVVKFTNNVLAETNKLQLIIEDKSDLAGLPDTAINTAAKKAKTLDMEGKWIFTTHTPSIWPFMKFADNRKLREKLYKMNLSRANNDDEFDNKEIFSEIIRLKTQKAKLLGHQSFSHFILEKRMAKTPEKVLNLLNEISDLALPVAKENIQELQDYLNKQKNSLTLEPWDTLYVSEKVREEKYRVDENEIKQYFTLKNVRDGMFAVANKLYGITLNEIKDIPRPHPDAEAFQVKEADGKHIGVLYLDYFSRESKQEGAWCSRYNKGCDRKNNGKHPTVSIVFNFSESTDRVPTLLNSREVLTMFHEFGHALDSLFAQNAYNLSYVSRDFVELPSQIFEHWATEPEVLQMYGKHWETGQIIPPELVSKIKNASLFNNGIDTIKQISYGLLDMSYHMIENASKINVTKHENDLFRSIGLTGSLRPGISTTFFTHIVGGYDSGYYGYMWAKILDTDAYEVFKEKGIFDQETASKFRKCILENKGIKDSMEMFIDFMGREPKVEPLLKHKGFI